MNGKYILILCMTSYRMQRIAHEWTHFRLDHAPNHFIRIIPKDSVKPKGTEGVIIEDLLDTDPQFADLVSNNEVIQEIRNAQIPLIMECYFDTMGNCTHVSYLSATYIEQHPSIDEKLNRLSYTIRQLNVADYLTARVPQQADYWRFNVIIY